MPKFKVRYYFDGQGEVKLEAKSKEEAEKKFFDGEFNEEDDKEWGENYFVNTVDTL